jgi:outer membrane protein OmpA-like peptidoglycan-associated protein
LPTSTNSNLPALDKQTIPRLTPSQGLKTPLVASPVPAPVATDLTQVPGMAPDVAETAPVQPPAIRDALASAPALQESAAERASHIPGNHLTLDPTISTVLFTRGSGNIDEKVVTTLDRLSGVLDSNPDVRVTLTAYADNTGSTPRDARRLSLTRALAVRDYLASKGIQDSRVDVRAEGANTTAGYLDRVDVKVND